MNTAAPKTPGETRRRDQISSVALAGAVALANLTLCAGLVAVVLAVGGRTAGDASGPAPSTASSPGDISAEMPAAEASAAEPTVDSPTPAAPARFETVSGPGGMTTVVPAGWLSVRHERGHIQANDPGDGTRYLRYNGYPPDAGDVYTVFVTYEREDFGPGHPGFQSIRLDRITVRGFDAVDWEFEWDAPEGRRHVRAIYWRARGYEYFVYASSRVTRWPETRQILDAMIDNASP